MATPFRAVQALERLRSLDCHVHPNNRLRAAGIAVVAMLFYLFAYPILMIYVLFYMIPKRRAPPLGRSGLPWPALRSAPPRRAGIQSQLTELIVTHCLKTTDTHVS